MSYSILNFIFNNIKFKYDKHYSIDYEIYLNNFNLLNDHKLTLITQSIWNVISYEDQIYFIKSLKYLIDQQTKLPQTNKIKYNN